MPVLIVPEIVTGMVSKKEGFVSLPLLLPQFAVGSTKTSRTRYVGKRFFLSKTQRPFSPKYMFIS